MVRVQVASIPANGEPVLLLGDPDCMADPCRKHERCHCMCPCMPDGEDNCDDCAEHFGEI